MKRDWMITAVLLVLGLACGAVLNALWIVAAR